jgi:hypothetical protein
VLATERVDVVSVAVLGQQTPNAEKAHMPDPSIASRKTKTLLRLSSAEATEFFCILALKLK